MKEENMIPWDKIEEFVRLNLDIEGENASNEWLEPVSDAEYENVNGQ